MENATGMAGNGWSKAKTILTVVVSTIVVLGFALSAGQVVATKLWGLEVKAVHDADILRLERKLDCALFDLPRGCRGQLAPRSP